ncbi:axonemal dynein light intermediate polypeptide 1 isoform X3 [Cyprinodon tularosa]|uniref:axonemal dynein light intermediate polypeptide 1 isoform X3 n=1 Tax=Cyprinodon tularosa TaxID=77115 RepID=UPI0018E21D76|nr:axonemal dynein light intermediate polypeptide 1 isoform X3 [Cyprinodon tularosa]
MIPTSDSLLKYNNPMSIKNSETKSPKQPSDFKPATPPSKSKPAISEDNEETKEVLEVIFPPREWMDGNQLWVQKVSTAPSTRADVIQLKKQLDTKLQQRQARLTGICPIRRELYSQCFDELIRQTTITCAEMGLLLLSVRDESQMTIKTYQKMIESSILYGSRKALQSELEMVDLEKRVEDLEREKQDLLKKMDEQKEENDVWIKSEAHKILVLESNYKEEIKVLKRNLQQLKMQQKMDEQKEENDVWIKREAHRIEVLESNYKEEIKVLKRNLQQLEMQL